MKIVPDKKYSQMFRIQWENGDLSDMYNLSWAKNHLATYGETTSRIKRRMAGKRTP